MIRNRRSSKTIKIPSYQEIAQENLSLKSKLLAYTKKFINIEALNKSYEERLREIVSTQGISYALCPVCDLYQHAGRITCEECSYPIDHDSKNSDDVIDLLNKSGN